VEKVWNTYFSPFAPTPGKTGTVKLRESCLMLHRIKKSAVGLWRDESGASLLEYSLLIGLILAVSATAVIAVGGWAGNQWSNLKGVLGVGTPP